MLREVERLASGPLAESFADSDRHPPVYDPATKSVTMPEPFKKSYQALMDAEWWRLDLPEELGGTGAPPSLRWAASARCCWAATRQPSCSCPARASPGSSTISATPTRSAGPSCIVEKRWGATMVLTEPDAGSDVGAGRTKAFDNGDGTWHIEGVKRFITSGEHDMADNIVHLVLARPEGAGPGTKGLSLFFVPKYLVDLETGELAGAQRRLRHQRREEDGPEGVDDRASSPSATGSRRSAGSSATCTTASRRCSRSSSTPG